MSQETKDHQLDQCLKSEQEAPEKSTLMGSGRQQFKDASRYERGVASQAHSFNSRVARLYLLREGGQDKSSSDTIKKTYRSTAQLHRPWDRATSVTWWPEAGLS